MKTKTFLAHVLWGFRFFVALISATPAMAQEAPNCSSCSCPNTFFSAPCSITCCIPQIASCNCQAILSECKCSGVASKLPIIYADRIRDFANYIRSGEFTSVEASKLSSELYALRQAHASGDTATFHTMAERIESDVIQLPANEKFLANKWIATRGGSKNTIP